MISTASVVVFGFLVIPQPPLTEYAWPDSPQTSSFAESRDQSPSREPHAPSRFHGPRQPLPSREKNRASGNGCLAGRRGVRRFHLAADPPPAAAAHAPVRGAVPTEGGTSPAP